MNGFFFFFEMDRVGGKGGLVVPRVSGLKEIR